MCPLRWRTTKVNDNEKRQNDLKQLTMFADCLLDQQRTHIEHNPISIDAHWHALHELLGVFIYASKKYQMQIYKYSKAANRKCTAKQENKTTKPLRTVNGAFENELLSLIDTQSIVPHFVTNLQSRFSWYNHTEEGEEWGKAPN